MKKIIFCVVVLFVFSNSYSQKEKGFRVGLDFGFVPASGGAGGMFSLEPKYNIKDNMNIGLRLGIAAIVRDLNTSGNTTTAKIAANGSYLGTYDYYFNASGKSFVPYIGAGAGYYTLANVKFDDAQDSNNVGLDTKGKMGGLLRGGFEWGKFRMGLEYNFVPDSNLQDIDGNEIGMASNSYLGIHLGFYIGGGKWGR